MNQHDRLTEIASDVRTALTAGDDVAARRALDDLLRLLEPHSTWEERGLFARMQAQGDFGDHVDVLEGEHVALYAEIDAAEEDERGWGAAVTDALDALDRHIYRENFGLFPGAIAVLDADDWEAIEAARPA